MSSSRELFAELLDKSPSGCLLLEGGVIKQVNTVAIEVMGIPRQRMIGVPLAELLVPEYEEACVDLLQRVGDRPESEPVRLAAGLAPVELTAKSLDDGVTVVSVRSMANEHYYSAQASGALTHDLTTGLPSHYHVLSNLNAELASSRRKPLALLCLWVDELAELADVNGKRAVQRVVKEVGQRIDGKLRAPDTLGRFDDAGFLIVMSSDAATEQLTEIAERLRAEVAFPVEFDGGLVSFTASIVVGTVNYDRPSIERILALLEAAANRAASSGGNRTEVLTL